jgi:hypothetical protein
MGVAHDVTETDKLKIAAVSRETITAEFLPRRLCISRPWAIVAKAQSWPIQHAVLKANTCSAL